MIGKEVSIFVAFLVIAAAVAVGWTLGNFATSKLGLRGA